MAPQLDNLTLHVQSLLTEWGVDAVATALAEIIPRLPPEDAATLAAALAPPAGPSGTPIPAEHAPAHNRHTLNLEQVPVGMELLDEETLRYQSRILELVPNAVIVTDPSGIIRYWNHHATVVYQWTAEETVGRPIIEFELADAPPEIYVAMMEQLRAGVTWSGEFLGRRRDGSRFPAFTTNTPFLDPSGAVIGVIGVAVDMSARRELEARIRFQARALDAIGQAVLITDQHGAVTYWNQAAVALYGWTAEQALGRNPFEFVAANWQHVADRLHNEPYEGEILLQRIDGTQVPVLLNVSPVFDEAGTLIGRVAVATDLSEQKHQEAERLMFERKLQEAQRLESLGILTGGIAHDFNNLLTPMLGYAELAALEVPPESEVGQALTQITLSARRAADLVAQLLSYAGRVPLDPQPVLLNGVIREMFELLQITVKDRARLVLDLDPALPPVLADVTQLRQVLLNVITNGTEAMNGGGDLTVRTSVEPIHLKAGERLVLGNEAMVGDCVCLTVSDTGRGMDVATQNRIFEPFFTTRANGRGLGLAAVHGIVRAHHGTLSIISAPGCGTTLRIWLPVSTAPMTADTTMNNVQMQPLAGTILVIDDDARVRRVISLMLERIGLKVVTAADGATGLALLDAGIAQLRAVLVDLSMPHLRGDTVAELIAERHPGVPVALMTGHNSANQDQYMQQHNLVAIMQKPIHIAALYDLIARLG